MALIKFTDLISDIDKFTLSVDEVQKKTEKMFETWKSGKVTMSGYQEMMQEIANSNKVLTDKEKEYNAIKKKSIQLQKQAEKEAEKISALFDKERQVTEELIRVKKRQVKEEAKLIAEKKRIIELQKKEFKSDKELIELNNKLVHVRANLTKNTRENRQEYAKLTAEIVRNEKAIRSSDAQIGRFQRNVGNYTGAIKSFGASMGLVGGAFLLANGIKSSINKIKDFEKAISNLRAITGASGKDLEYLKNQALKLAASTGNSAVDIVEAFKLVASAKPELLSNVEALNKTTEAVITLSQASGMDLQESTVALTSIMNQFGAGADEATKYINVLGAGAKFGSGEIDFLSEAMVKAGSVSKSAGLSVETLTAAMELFAEKGVKAEIAGTGFKSLLVKMQSDTKNYTNGQFDLNKAIQNYQGIATDNVALVKTFGREYFNLAGILLTNKDRFYELEKQVTGTNTAIEQAAINMDNLSGDLEKAGGAWDAFVLSVNEGSGSISTSIREVVKFFTKLLTVLIKVNEGMTVYQGFLTQTADFRGEIDKFNKSLEKTLKYYQDIQTIDDGTFEGKKATDADKLAKKLEYLNAQLSNNQETLRKYEALAKKESTAKYDYQILLHKERIKIINENISGLSELTTVVNKETDANNDGNKTIKKQIELRKELLKLETAQNNFKAVGAGVGSEMKGTDVEAVEKEIKNIYEATKKTTDDLIKKDGTILGRLFGGGEKGEQAAQALNEVWAEFSQVYNQYLQQQIDKYDELINKREESIESVQKLLDAEIEHIEKVKEEGQAYDLSKKKALEDQLKNEQKYLAQSINEQKKAKQKAKNMAIAEANMNIAGAILQVWNQSGVWWVKLAQSIAMAAIGAVQLSTIKTQQFAEGTEYVELNGAPDGIDTVHAKLTKGEKVLSVEQSRQIPRWFKNDWIPDAVNYFINSKGQVIIKEDKKALKHLEGIERNTAKDKIYNEKGKLIKEIKGNHNIYYN